MRVHYCVAHTTTVSQNRIWHVYFFFILKYLCNPLLHIYTINLLKPCLFQSSNETGCSVGLRQTNELLRLIYTKQDFWDYFNIINISFDSVTLATDGPQNTGHNTIQGYPRMDHCIGCHTRAFTVAYAVLWLEVYATPYKSLSYQACN